MAAISFRSVVTWQKNSFKWGVKLFSFESFGLEMAVVKRLEEFGIFKPTEIQEKAISSVMMEKNTIINAETGSGKTLCYLLPIVNRLLVDTELSTRHPYALILLPTVELCYQVAEVFRKVSGPSLIPSIVHKDERLQLSTRHHVVMATPATLLSYSPTVLENVQVVVIDEADHMITSGGKDVWTLLNLLKTRTTIKNISEFPKRNRKIIDEEKSRTVGECVRESAAQRRQFIFVAATLPTRGRKAAYNVLRRWLPDAELITSSLVHQTVPEVQIKYVKVEEELKLPALLHCLKSLAAGSVEVEEKCHLEMDTQDENMLGIRQPSHLDERSERNEPEEDRTASKDKGEKSENYSSSRNSSNSEEDDHGFSVSHSFPSADRLRVLVFANSAKHAAQAFQFLNGVEEESGQLSPVHVATTPSSRDASGESTSLVSPRLCSLEEDFWEGKCGQIHKDVPPLERIATLEKFKSGHLNVLVCTDLAARGLDLPRVSHVIQLDFASNAAQVLHRIGRTARAGAPGNVINFVTSADEDLVRAVRSSETGPGAAGYQPTFSRNRMFRRRVKANKLSVSQLSAQNSS